MESLSDTIWDVVITGTGLGQSLLALALSRSGKKILHVDKHTYYGGAEAAFSLQDASTWVSNSQNTYGPSSTIQPTSLRTTPNSDKLGASRAYTLTLSPHLIYSQSALLPALVSSRLHTQLEFQAVGTWWILKNGPAEAPLSGGGKSEADHESTHDRVTIRNKFILQKIPSTREDVFADDSLPPRDKRSLMKFLRSVLLEPRLDGESAEDATLQSALTALNTMIPTLQQPLLALSLSYDSVGVVKTRAVAQRIRRHVRSIGAFGPGFGAVMPKYGGAAEIAQVACRASAVGGAVYVLGRGIQRISHLSGKSEEVEAVPEELIGLELSDGELIKARVVTGCAEDFPIDNPEEHTANSHNDLVETVHSIAIVSSLLEHLFPPTSESGPVPAGVVVVYDGGELEPISQDDSVSEKCPVNMVIHSSESGECPSGQCVIYSSTISRSEDGVKDLQRLDTAVESLLEASTLPHARPELLWSLGYRAKGRSIDSGPGRVQSSMSGRVLIFPPPSIDPAFDDSILENVKEVWKRVKGDEVEESDFLKFEERGLDNDEEL